MDKAPGRKIKNRRCQALRGDKESSSSSTQQNASPAMDSRTQRPKRKASPEKETQRKRRRASEMAEPCGSNKEDGIVRRGKRKVMDDGEGPSKQQQKKKKMPVFYLLKNNEDSASTSVDTESSDPLEGCSTFVSKKSVKRKATAEGEGPKKKRRLDPKETKKEVEESVDAQRAQFKAKYKQQKQLGEGGCGSVFAGYRKADHLPVAIKHIPKNKVFCKETDQNGNELSVEVAVMLKLSAETPGSVGTSAPVSLLDWYDLGQKLILVLERPVPCEDLFTYLEVKRGTIQEEEAKIIVKQLLQAATELENQRIFHRDIKLENILIETGSDVPRVRLIDFGLSCFFKKRSVFQDFYGTCDHIPPEYYSHFTYSASPTTVWQVGVVLFEMFHRRERFETRKFLTKKLKINKQLSENCQDFLKMCLTKLPARRPTLEQLQLHPWLR
ncbi:serine/threonine-protein kinase pim-1-like [Seriola aureovittata]|uniref:serine/threonine-protein kinase pim-1-like n=1 Tax=Seriola aureovittata TaxID=2871759 RepID=UPI0024BD8A85|nr:serine/threonine-protein kinase pim-1-like [Seriola aureovittata]